ncbi:MAG: aquaporin [Cyanobacteria bacterium P01_A01_bin.83]
MITITTQQMLKTLREHLPEYLMEAGEVSFLVMSIGFLVTVFEHPNSPIHQTIPDNEIRRILFGVALGLVITGLIYSSWGKQSGAHMNPAFTLAFYRLGKIKFWDAFFYILFQFAGAITGIYLVAIVLGSVFTEPPINWVRTAPGSSGLIAAFTGELIIAFFTLFIVLNTINNQKLNKYTGVIVGILNILYIIFEAPLSGASMNPARSFASTLLSRNWTGFWLYILAPTIGMLMAVELYQRLNNYAGSMCAKLNHHNQKRCIFCLSYYDKPVNLSDYQGSIDGLIKD